MESREEEKRRLYWQPKLEMQQFSRTQADVCSKLANHMMSKKAPGENMVFSPLSIHVVLGLMSAAFKGQPREQLLAYLNSGSCQEFGSLMSQLLGEVFADGTPFGGPCLSFANGMWLHNGFQLKETFKGVLDQSCRAPITRVDFQNQADAVRKEVNEWAEQKTNGLITEILPPDSVSPWTRLIFANALYFKGAWAETFDASKTRDGEFVLLDGKRIRVPFITSTKNQQIGSYNSFFNGSFKVLKLPYQNYKDRRQFSMYFYLPNKKDGLPALVKRFGSEPGFIEKHIPISSVEVGDFRFPKFKISYKFKACEVLKRMGLVKPFTSNLTELAHLADNELPLNGSDSEIFHKSFIEVDEKGAKAAAVSAWGVPTSCCLSRYKPPKVDFVADHPFLFVIREDKTRTVLFVGQLLNPLD